MSGLGMDVREQSAELLKGLSSGIEDAAPYVASAYKELYDELRDEGFSEEQAMEILTESELLLARNRQWKYSRNLNFSNQKHERSGTLP